MHPEEVGLRQAALLNMGVRKPFGATALLSSTFGKLSRLFGYIDHCSLASSANSAEFLMLKSHLL